MPCLFPFYAHNPRFGLAPAEPHRVPVPCGSCPDCLTNRTNGWQLRLLAQEKISSSAAFVTLTYSTTHVPITPKGYMTVVKRDFQLFMKRLRKLHPKTSVLRYYACAEYGSTSWRPHYHALIFNVHPELLPKAWDLGDVHLGSVTGASIAYTLKYINKGRRIPAHKNDDRQKEFSLMSKKMGVNYLTPEIIAYHKSDLSRTYCVLPGGVKIAMPRYFREKIYSPTERAKIAKNVSKVSEQRDLDNRTIHAQRTGTPDTYERDQFQSKKSAISNFRNNALKSRK